MKKHQWAGVAIILAGIICATVIACIPLPVPDSPEVVVVECESLYAAMEDDTTFIWATRKTDWGGDVLKVFAILADRCEVPLDTIPAAVVAQDDYAVMFSARVPATNHPNTVTVTGAAIVQQSGAIAICKTHCVPVRK